MREAHSRPVRPTVKGALRYGARTRPKEHLVSEPEPEQELDQPDLDDGERALRDAEKLREHEQEEADNDFAPIWNEDDD